MSTSNAFPVHQPGSRAKDPHWAAGTVAEARLRARETGSGVLDELLRTEPELAEKLEALTGVSAVCEPVQWPTAHRIPGHEERMLLVRNHDGVDWLLMLDPWDADLVREATVSVGRYVEPVAATLEVVRSGPSAQGHARGLLASASQAGAQTSAQPVGSSRPQTAEQGPGGVEREAAPGAVQFVDRCILAAYSEGASDVHFECDRQGLSVKLRLDGVLRSLDRLQGVQPAEEVISRIKVMAQLDITERRLPQDGRLRFEGPGLEFDLRVSIMPSVFGEDAVLRLLDKSQLRKTQERVSLDGLGFTKPNAAAIRALAGLPNGLLLVTGPTGSGKTTTVYAALSEINTGQEKIITIEDPVEYELPGVLQIPVNERKGLTFAKGLRSILRHDPDRILVGEIRDAETAEIAVQSALTGHLVFTTVHANSLFDVIGRFRHFGIDMFGFVSSLNGVVVQRLIRRLCGACAGQRPATEEELAWFARHGVPAPLHTLPEAVGCEHCHHTGYRGRFVLAEVHRLDDTFRDRVIGQADVTELKRLAFGGAARPLVEQGAACVQSGVTTLEELFRVVGQT